MARANALLLLGGYELGYSAEAVAVGLNDPEPLVRLHALQSIGRMRQNKRHEALKRLLSDPIKAIRTDVARIAVEHLPDFTEPSERALLLSVLEEYKAIQTQQSDLPEAHTNLAAISMALGQFEAAEKQLRKGLAIEPEWIPGLVNLADLYRRVGRDSEAGDILEKAIAIKPPTAAVQIAYGMWLIRSGRPSDALNQFQRSYELEPGELRNCYLYALALNANNRREQAIGVAELAVDRFGDHRILLELLATMYRDAESFDEALRYTTRLEERFGGDAYRTLRAQMLLAIRKRDGPS
jgi:tetratricopeptide (TPR) repeat protein